MIRSTLALFLAGSDSAQPDMLITVDNVSGDQWEISAEYFGPPVGFGHGQIWSDTGFDLNGDGSTITITDYNPAYDTQLGPASVTNGPTATFIGSASAFFGTPDPSNPLFVANFTYGGAFGDLELDLVGQNAAVFDNLPSPSVLLYQDSFGNPGPLSWDVRYIPAPATLALAPMALVTARRRRRRD